MMEFWIEISERQRKKKKKKKALGLLLFPTEEQASIFSEICLEESHMIRPWRKMVQESRLVIRGSPPSSREKVHPDKKEIKQKEKGDLFG